MLQPLSVAGDSRFAYPPGIKPLLRFQLNGSFNGLKGFASQATDDEWTARPFDGANLIGFTVWHAARSLDWVVNCVLRDLPELVEGAEWKDVRHPEAFFGAGATREAADNVARTVPRQRVIEYLSAMGPDALAWLDSTPQEWFDQPVDLKSARARERGYADDPVWPEIEDLHGIPRWQFLARPGISHLRVHYGEMTSQLESLRA
ncbi:MAG: hypothetical protein E6I42_03550 [Chloroflexi bacterium]|nr:MAG: hypothetical protein E6I42_03550 [Chloroflexota bacterium]TMG23734.1 MAG: hypothetical protein E6H97_11255 [Chloroflexota bacterium]